MIFNGANGNDNTSMGQIHELVTIIPILFILILKAIRQTPQNTPAIVLPKFKLPHLTHKMTRADRQIGFSSKMEKRKGLRTRLQEHPISDAQEIECSCNLYSKKTSQGVHPHPRGLDTTLQATHSWPPLSALVSPTTFSYSQPRPSLSTSLNFIFNLNFSQHS